MESLGAYVHIPFCLKKCAYCDFLSFSGLGEEAQAAYAKALLREIEGAAALYAGRFSLDSVFFGGGTPSFPPASMVTDAIAALRASFSFARDAEITVEANPGTLDEGKLDAYLRAGANRLSIGAQSMDGAMLRRLGRAHGRDDTARAYAMARRAGFGNISLDMIFAIPGQSARIWEESLSEAIALGPEHMSFYAMQIEKGTPLWRECQGGRLQPVDDETDRQMYHAAVAMLEGSGLRRYEISNAAREGRRCRHNLRYWSMGDYLGLGLGAHSFIDGVRMGNRRSMAAYARAGAEGGFRAWSRANTERDSISEFIFLGMRRADGISAEAFRGRFGHDFLDMFGREAKKLAEAGLIELVVGGEGGAGGGGAGGAGETGGEGGAGGGLSIRLTDRGFDFADAVFVEFVEG
ncbi:MAG: radical SAM family heme chaperone HemW [Clostridiales Family XIII bacterium]|nr:radical SAM family heme chaperone HemW [Clostridiales Family XIII bacterium]